VALGVPHGAFVDGHPAQVLIPTLGLLAAVGARNGQGARAGVLLGLSTGLEAWGLLGLPVLLLSRGARQTLQGVLAQALTILALFAPFALAGDFETFSYRWEVAEDTIVAFVLDPGTPFSWPMRLVQGGLALLIGAVTASRLRRSRQGLWAVPLAVVGVRLLLDPELNGWYFLAFETLALAGAASLLAGGPVHDVWSSRTRARAEEGPRPTAD
jgi:hypothetical protein